MKQSKLLTDLHEEEITGIDRKKKVCNCVDFTCVNKYSFESLISKTGTATQPIKSLSHKRFLKKMEVLHHEN